MDKLPVPVEIVDDPSFLDEVAFVEVPTIVVYDAPPVQRGQQASFKIQAIGSPDETFTVRVETRDGTATEADDDYVPIESSEFTFTGEGTINVQTGGVTLDAEEFYLVVTAISPLAVLKGIGVAYLGGVFDTGVYTQDTYDDDVYE